MKHFLKGAALGAIFASVATLLLAPKAGKKTRKEVTSLVSALMAKLNRETGELSSLSREKYEELVHGTVREYARGKKLAKKVINDVSDVLKSNWVEISKELKKK